MNNVLIYGDLMIDRSWIVSGRVETTVQAHGDVTPLRRVAPGRFADRLGGAGLTADAIANVCKTSCVVHLLASAGNVPERLLKDITLHQIPYPDEHITTLKFRVYDLNEKGKPVLRARFDQDAPAIPSSATLPGSLPSSQYLVISDFKKGAVREELLEQLLERFDHAEVLVDSKDSKLFDKCDELRKRGGVLFLNREEATRMWQHYMHRDDLDITLTREHCQSDLLHLGEDLLTKLPKWNIVVKLDRDGAMLFSGKEYWIKTADGVEREGIGAGDVFLAGWLQGLALGATDRAKLLCHATDVAGTWVKKGSEPETWEKAWQDHREAPSCSDIIFPTELSSDTAESEAIKIGLENARKSATYPECIAQKRLDLASANFGLGGVRILNSGRRREVLHFVQKIESYLERRAPCRPFNCVLAAKPGTGKSFLLKQLAEKAKCDFYEVNVSQFASSTGFMDALARIAHTPPKREGHTRILMIDEADTLLAGQHVYPLLLTPLWDGEIIHQGERYSLGLHFVTVLVASTSETPDKFRKELREKWTGDKGPDLESRLNGADLALTAPTRERAGRIRDDEVLDADYAILIGSMVRKYYPHVRWISRLLFEMLYESNLSPRDLEYALLHLEPPSDGYITFQDVEKLAKARNYRLSEESAFREEWIQLFDAS